MFRVVTFADGSPLWKSSARRLAKEVAESPLLSRTDISSNYSPLQGPDFQRLVSLDSLKKNPRGSGFWIWKPFLIKHSLENLRDYETGVLYLDAGCTFNSSAAASKTLVSYFAQAKQFGTLLFELSDQPELKWTKKDLFLRLGVADTALTQSNQRHSTAHFWTPTDLNFKILDDWIAISLEEKFHYLDDSPSRAGNVSGFIEHRHDQSILSTISKFYGIRAIPDETWHHPGWIESGANYPIWATRNRSSVSVMDTRIKARSTRKLEGLVERFRKL